MRRHNYYFLYAKRAAHPLLFSFFVVSFLTKYAFFSILTKKITHGGFQKPPLL
nr:MAG TPA: hypothetical protein [Caudoviricetes sp.]